MKTGMDKQEAIMYSSRTMPREPVNITRVKTNGGESLSQMVNRLMHDHGWDRYMALRAAEYYRDEMTFTALCIALGRKKATQIGNMR